MTFCFASSKSMKKGVGSGVTSPTAEGGKSGLPAGIYRRESFAIKKTNTEYQTQKFV
jgi:hypothetical protein